VDTGCSGTRPPGPDEVHVVVEPDRQPRPEAQDQVVSDPRLTLRERVRAGIVGIPRAAAATPLRRPVGVQVDAAAILARATGEPVGVQVGDEPKVEARPDPLERAKDRDTGTPGSMDAADHKHARTMRITDAPRFKRRPTVRA